MLGIYERTKTKKITIRHKLTESSVSAHHSIEFLLNLNDKN